MVLSRLTKITGPGVATDTNWVGNNADFTGITTTATSFNIGVTTIHSNLIEAHNIKSTGIITATGGSFSGNVTAVDGTFSGNVSIAGTLTYEDVTNIDSVGIITARSDVKVGTGVTLTPAGAGFFAGIVTAREGIFIPDTKKLQIGNAAGSADLKIFHEGTLNKIQATSNLLIGDENYNLITMYPANGGVNLLYTGGHIKLATTHSGVVVSGILTATSFSGDGSGLTNIGITTEQVTPSSNVATLDLSKDEHKIVASGTYTVDVSGGTESESHVIRIENSGISTVGFSTYFKFPSGGTPALPTASGAISLISFTVHKVGSVGIATVLLAGASVNYS